MIAVFVEGLGVVGSALLSFSLPHLMLIGIGAGVGVGEGIK